MQIEPEESVAHKQDPDRDQQCVSDYDYKKARYRNDSKDACGQEWMVILRSRNRWSSRLKSIEYFECLR
jgi:hypothetical protein